MRFGTREILFTLILLAMPVAAWYWVFLPENKQIAQAREEIRQRQAKLQQLEVQTMRNADLDAEIEKLTKAIALFEAKLPGQKEIDVVLEEVWQLAAQHNLTQRSVRTEQPVAHGRYSEIPLKMIIVGDFDAFYAFLLDLERLPRITQIKDMEIRKLQKAEEGQMQAAFKLSIYFEPDAAGDDPADRT